MKTILIVDDEKDISEIMRLILTEEGYLIESSTSAKEALEILDNNQTKPDLIITDYMMPHLSGYDLIQSLKNRSSCKAIPVILMSATNPHFTILPIWDKFLKKPFTIEKLIDLAKSTINQQYPTRKPC